MYIASQTLVVPVSAQGGATAYFDAMNGEIKSLSYVKPSGDTAYADGVTFAITNERTGEGIWSEAAVNASKTVRPTAVNQDQVGADLDVESDVPNRRPIFLANERVKVVITLGGISKTGTFVLKVG